MVISVLILVLGGFGALVLGSWFELSEDSDRAELFQSVLTSALFVGVGLLALRPLGKGALGQGFPLETRGAHVALALGLGLLMFAGNWIYVEGLASALDLEVTELDLSNPILAVLTIVLLPSLVEEFMDRGVAWTVLRRSLDVRQTILCTALVFGFLHGLNGGGLLEVPHRVLMGCVLGWLRARTASLTPGILAHGVNNALALVL